MFVFLNRSSFIVRWTANNNFLKMNDYANPLHVLDYNTAIKAKTCSLIYVLGFMHMVHVALLY